MRILGFQKTTLLDYPHKLASTIFLGGCNFRCPFCQNAQLVLPNLTVSEIPVDQILSHLKKRMDVLEGVCITGGEPLLNPDLYQLVDQIKSLGYSVKIDTNGSNPDMLNALIHEHSIDFVSMDIKNSPDKYSMTAGHAILFDDIQRSVDLLKHGRLPYEFRTTVVKELHTEQDLIEIGKWLQGTSTYFLQTFVNSDHIIQPGRFSSYDLDTMRSFVNKLKNYLPNTSLRGDI